MDAVMKKAANSHWKR